MYKTQAHALLLEQYRDIKHKNKIQAINSRSSSLDSVTSLTSTKSEAVIEVNKENTIQAEIASNTEGKYTKTGIKTFASKKTLGIRNN